jgi:hypothetical protein
MMKHSSTVQTLYYTLLIILLVGNRVFYLTCSVVLAPITGGKH